MILTCDRYPKEIKGLEDRLKSRLGWGLPVVIEPPELETRVAITLSKADEMGCKLDEESAFFLAQKEIFVYLCLSLYGARDMFIYYGLLWH